MLHRAHRLLMLCCFIALQAMAPFIHAHAGAVQPNHTGFLHLHQAVPCANTAWHATAANDHGPEVTVATGLPLRHATLGVPPQTPPAAVRMLPRTAATPCPGVDLPAPPPRFAHADHTLPPALAPPAR